MNLGYNAAQKVKGIHGGMFNWKLFLEAMAELELRKNKDIGAYAEQLARTNGKQQMEGEPLTELLVRIREEKLDLDSVKAAVDEQLGNSDEVVEDCSERASGYVEMLQNMTTELPELLKQLDAGKAAELNKAIADFNSANGAAIAKMAQDTDPGIAPPKVELDDAA